MINKIHCGHFLDISPSIPDDFVDTIITSPPYFGLRDYGDETKTIWGGKKDCEHIWNNAAASHDNLRPSKISEKTNVGSNKNPAFRSGKNRIDGFCSKCGAWSGQLGLEPTLDLYLVHLWQITDELYRVLKPTGVMFWNHGDSYGGSGNRKGHTLETSNLNRLTVGYGATEGNQKATKGFEKCMLLQNYRLILAMIDQQGWILRNDIKWCKKNHMPSSVKDRFTNAHEPIFMLVKNKKYWFDLDAVRVKQQTMTKEKRNHGIVRDRGFGYKSKEAILRGRKERGVSETYPMPTGHDHNLWNNPTGKNPGDVWRIATQPRPEAHFAAFPDKLVIPMIKAGCPAEICKKCGKARARISKPSEKYKKRLGEGWHKHEHDFTRGNIRRKGHIRTTADYQTLGWTDCKCGAGFRPGVVLDPFGGRGTVAIMAKKLGRSFIHIDIKKEYCEMAEKNIEKECGGLL